MTPGASAAAAKNVEASSSENVDSKGDYVQSGENQTSVLFGGGFDLVLSVVSISVLDHHGAVVDKFFSKIFD